MIASLMLCVLLDMLTPFDGGGAFHLRPVGDLVEMDSLAPPAEKQTPALMRSRVVAVAPTIQVLLSDGPVSARTPAARPPPVP